MLPIQSMYQSLREQLVAIVVEIEDKENVCKMLERKLLKERQHLASIESVVNDEYDSKAEVISHYNC